eukprot:jgi/Chrzof1/9651/Cz04g11010.t1
MLQTRRTSRIRAILSEGQEPLLPNPEYQPQARRSYRSRIKAVFQITIPTMFDLIATALMNVGLLYVAASGK